jgi:TIR domain
VLFLSCAEEDNDRGRAIASWFKQQGISVYYWEDHRGVPFIEQMEKQLNEASAFLALDSRYFALSPWCHREYQLAMLREMRLRRNGHPEAQFIWVARLADEPEGELRFLDAYDRFDLTDPATALSPLFDSLVQDLRDSSGIPVNGPDGAAGPSTVPGVPLEASAAAHVPPFRNREDELDRVLRGITTDASGEQFWLIVAPPQLGKTWFLDQIAVKLRAERGDWTARRVDLRDCPPEHCGSVPWVLGHLFHLDEAPVAADSAALMRIATQIIDRRRPHLCLLDSAELLADETVQDLRTAIAEVNRLVRAGNIRGVQVALVVASRADEPWLPISPAPRLSLLPLSEFRPDVVTSALIELADQAGRRYSGREMQELADRVYRMSEGLPELLATCLHWVHEQRWIDLHRLEEHETFEELARKYVTDGLLGEANLFWTDRPQDPRARYVVETAYRSLVVYRMFTRSHLKYHAEDNAVLAVLLTDIGWDLERLSDEIRGTVLLARQRDNPWHEIQCAIRRLLFRYFYPSPAARSEAHARARAVVDEWTRRQSGRDQAVGLIESMWHQAAVLGQAHYAAELAHSQPTDPRQAANDLRASAATMVAALESSDPDTTPDRRRWVAERMRSDLEFQSTVAWVPGLFEELVGIVDVPMRER